MAPQRRLAPEILSRLLASFPDRQLKFVVTTPADLPEILKDVLKLYLNKNLRAETGSMLYMLDAHHFANFLGRFNSRNKDANYRLFADPEAAMATSKRLSMQWDKVEKKRKKRAKLAVVA